MSPQVSVLMTVRNGERYLAQTLDALERQTFANYELVVNDNGSTDRTLDILRDRAARDARIRILEPVSGERTFTMGIRRAFEAAGAPFAAVNDADDISRPDRLQKQVDCLNEAPGVVAVASWYEHIDEGGRVFETCQVPARIRDAYQTGNPVSHSSLMYRRDAAVKAGAYRGTLTFASDFALQIEMARQGGEIAIIAEPLVQIRVHDAQTSNQKNQRSQYYREPLEILSAAAVLPQVSAPARLHGMFTRQKLALRYGLALWAERRFGESLFATALWLLASLTSLWALVFVREKVV